MKVIINILIVSLLVFSCQNPNDEYKNKIIKFNLKKLPEIKSVKLSDLGFVDIEYIPLETTKNSVISRIKEIKFGDGFFLIKYYNTILEFQDDGSFITIIGTEGRGPSEFTIVHDIDIDKKNQNIYLADGWQQRFYVYSKNGVFIRTFPTPIYAEISFRFTNEGILCYNMNQFGNVENSYNLIDTVGRIIKNFPNKYPWNKAQKGTAIFNENLFFNYKNQLFKKEVYSDTVYVFEGLDFKPYLVIEHGDKLLNINARSDLESLELFEKYVNQINLFEFGDYIYYEFMYDFKFGGSNILRGFIGSKKDNSYYLINSDKGLINDLDGGPNICPITTKDDNTIIGWINALQLKNHIASEAFNNSIPKYPEKKKELEKLAHRLNETDNPILILAKLKK